MSTLVHLIPADDVVCPSDAIVEDYSSSSPSSSPMRAPLFSQDKKVSSSKSSSSNTISASQFFDLAIDDLQKARYVMCAAASTVVKREAMVVNKRLNAYHKRAHKRRMQRKIQKHLLRCPRSHAVPLDSDQAVETSAGGNEQQQQIPPFAGSISSSDLSSTNSNNDDQEEQLPSVDSVLKMEDEIHEQTSIMNQANRMKLMSILLRSIESNQRLLLRELMNCKQAALEDEEYRELFKMMHS